MNTIKLLVCILFVYKLEHKLILNLDLENFYYNVKGNKVKFFNGNKNGVQEFEEKIKKIAFLKYYIFIQDEDDNIVYYKKDSEKKILYGYTFLKEKKFELLIYLDFIVLKGLNGHISYTIPNNNNNDNDQWYYNQYTNIGTIFFINEFVITNNRIYKINNNNKLKRFVKKKIEIPEDIKDILDINNKNISMLDSYYSILNNDNLYENNHININKIEQYLTENLNDKYILKKENGNTYLKLFKNNNFEKIEVHEILDFYLSDNNQTKNYKFLLFFKKNELSKQYDLFLIDDKNEINMQIMTINSIKNVKIKKKFNRIGIYKGRNLLKKINFLIDQYILNRLIIQRYQDFMDKSALNIFISNKLDKLGKNNKNISNKIEKNSKKLKVIMDDKNKLENDLKKYYNIDIIKDYNDRNLDNLKFDKKKRSKMNHIKRLLKLYNYLELKDLDTNKISQFSETNLNDLIVELNN